MIEVFRVKGQQLVKYTKKMLKTKGIPCKENALEMYETRLKAVSFLKYEETGYKQAPYEPITKEQYEEMIAKVTPIQRVDSDQGGVGSKFCSNDTCTI